MAKKDPNHSIFDDSKPIPGFHAVEWSRQAKIELQKKWIGENGKPDWEKLKQILEQDPKSDSSTSR